MDGFCGGFDQLVVASTGLWLDKKRREMLRVRMGETVKKKKKKKKKKRGGELAVCESEEEEEEEEEERGGELSI